MFEKLKFYSKFKIQNLKFKMFYLVVFYVFCFGLIIGSFLNCLIWRLYKDESIWNRSYCPVCKSKIAWFDNIPVLSYLFLFGKCRKCKKKISFQYPAVEIITGFLFLFSFLLNTNSLAGAFVFNDLELLKIFRDFFVIAVMIVIFIYDFRWYMILDRVTLPACVIILLTNLALGMNWQNLLLSAIIGLSFFLVQFVLSGGKWIGGGDLRLGLLIGIIFGWPYVLVVIFLAYIFGSIIGLVLILTGNKKWGSKLPLGTFLSLASILVLFWGEMILEMYLKLLF